MYLYFEVYNLSLKDEQSRYRIDQTVKPVKKTNLFSRFIGLFRGSGSTVSISKEHAGASATSYEYTAFDFSKLSTGNYELTIRVTDMNNGEETGMTSNFELF